ncbi:MAG: hypothetical protein ACOYM2_09415 [Rectinemataceae bacterium]
MMLDQIISREDLATLVGQHNRETGQAFEEPALARVWELTRGQPWLTNSLLQKCVWQLCPKGETVTIAHIEEAKELLIQARAVHLDSLSERLRDPTASTPPVAGGWTWPSCSAATGPSSRSSW